MQKRSRDLTHVRLYLRGLNFKKQAAIYVSALRTKMGLGPIFRKLQKRSRDLTYLRLYLRGIRGLGSLTVHEQVIFKRRGIFGLAVFEKLKVGLKNVA